MPLYEYECRKCGERLEVMQKMTDKPLAKHPKCGGRLEKLLSAPAIQFKGSGWYVTDYAGKKSEGKEEKGAGKSSSEGSGDKATSTDTASSKKASKPKAARKGGD